MEKEDISSQEGRKYELPARERAREPSQGDLKTENNNPENDNDDDNSNNNNNKSKEDSEESRKRAQALEKKLEKVRRKKEEKEKARARAKGKMGIVVLHEDLVGEEFWERRGEVVFEDGC